MDAGRVGRVYDVEKMLRYFAAVFQRRDWRESARALEYAKEQHAGAKRSDGQPYIVHPLGMAEYALSTGNIIVTDGLVAMLLLHDVPEETGMSVYAMPFSPGILQGVDYMTFERKEGESKYEMKLRKYADLRESLYATIGKGIDRLNNLSTMAATFEGDTVRKNIVETDMLLLPALVDGEEKWESATGLLHLIRMNVRTLNDNLALRYGVKLTDPDFHNPPDARDYTHLLTSQ